MYRKVQHLDQSIQSLNKALEKQQGSRLLFGLSTFALFICSQIFPGLYLELLASGITLPLYLYFFRTSQKKKSFLLQLTRLKAFYNQQIAIKAGEKIEKPLSTATPHPELTRDLDLQEFFPYLDQTLSLEGETQLLRELTGVKEVSLSNRHQWLQQLAQAPGVLRRLQILPPQEKLSLQSIEETLQLSFLPQKRLLPLSIVLLWVLNLIFAFTHPAFVQYSFIPFIFLTLSYLQQTHPLFSRLQDLQLQLEKLEPILAIVHRLPQTVNFLPSLKSLSPQKNIGKIRNLVSLQSFRANPILYYLINFIFPWSVLINELSEKNRKNIVAQFKTWREELVLFEVIHSATTLYIYQTKTLPTVSSNDEFSLQNIIHPLLGQKKAIANSFKKEAGKSLFLITGSNMSGKSTFLRSVGINYCLARMGAPVWADEFHFPNAEIITCIRVSDSLRDGKSYFFSEVLRLKEILTKAQKKQIFFLIDEPLKGTNNRERLAGNQAFLEQMIRTQSLGFIATHDLDLTSLEDRILQLQNFHFTESWKNQDLYFDYKIKRGPSESTNALKIMEREGLVPTT